MEAMKYTRASFFAFFLLPAIPMAAQPVKVIRETKHDVSAPLRNAASAAPLPPRAGSAEADEEAPETALRAEPIVSDPAIQRAAGARLTAVLGVRVSGLGAGFSGPQGTFQLPYAPPDPNAAVGATQVVETVNLGIAVFDKTTGATLLGPIPIARLWDGFNTACAAEFLADPIVLYDKIAQRWMIKIVTLNNPFFTCVAVSTSSDATGTYNRYAFEQSTQGNLTGEEFGLWPDAYYFSQATFLNTNMSSYVGPEACALDRNQMLAGQAATMQCFQLAETHLHGMIPADLDGAYAPPAGAQEYYLLQGPAGSNSLEMYRFHVDFTNPANSTFTGPTSIKVAPYTPASADSVVSVPQLGTSQLLDANGSDLMHRLAYRNFASAGTPYEALVVAHSVMAGSGSGRTLGMRWYEIRNPATTPAVFQQGTYSPDNNYRWMGSVAEDKMGDFALGYSVSSSTMYPGIRLTGRVPADPLNTMEAEVDLLSGSGSQTGGGRWGDYTSVSVDPVDDCTMWYTNEYMAGTGAVDWATYLVSFKFPGCQ